MKTDLRYLEHMTEGDKALIKEMIGIFSTQVREYGVLMNRYLKEGNWNELGKMAHKAKSTVAIMGMKALSERLKLLEVFASKGENQESYAGIVNHFTSECEEAVKELQLYE